MRASSVTIALLVLAALSTLAAGCSCEGPRTATQVVVVIDADETVRGSATTLLIEVFGDAAMSAPAFPATMRESPTFAASPGTWPRIIALAPENRDPTRIYRVVATASDGTSTVAVARVISGYVAGEVRTVRLYLSARCAPEACQPSETCDAISGDCIDAHVEPEDLEPYEPDAGPTMDAGPTTDGAVDPCPGGCDDEIDCTVDVCTASGCTNTTNDAACDDDEGCTVDSCTATGCANAPAPDAACDDDEYCNGADTCDASGRCTTHAGDPCDIAGGSLTCDEADETCDGACTDRGDCPADSFGAWSVCDYAATCDTTASRTREQRVWACNGTMCVETVTPQSEPCTRLTEGTSCGTGGCAPPGACDYDGECDNAAMRSQTCTNVVCRGDVCGSEFRTEMLPCTRPTVGMSCFAGCSGTCNATGICSASCGMDAGFDAGRDSGFDAGRDAPEVGPDTGPDVREVGITDAPVSTSEVGSDGFLDAL